MMLLVFLVAFLYSSVGHGGASGYIAVMALFSLAPAEIRVNALLMNIAVAGISFSQFIRTDTLHKKLVIPLLLTSIPMAFLGGSLVLKDQFFKYLLALVLILPVLRFSGVWKPKDVKSSEPVVWALLVAGSAIGLISGMLGIGGGIILTPLLLWFGWATTKQAALVSALFIVVNSLAGFMGLLKHGITLENDFFLLLMMAVAGGTWGAYYGAMRFSPEHLKRVLALVLTIAIVKLITY